jgi:hypothetical protein
MYIHQLETLKKQFIYSDYGKFYESLHFILKGKNPYTPIYYLPEATPKQPHPTNRLLGGNLNPPFFNLMLLPLGLLSYAVSFYVWQIISALCGIISILLLQKALDLKLSHPALFTLSLIAALFVYYPTYANIWLGQVALVAFPFIIGAWLAVQRSYWRTAGCLLAIATSIKLFFGLFFLYFFIRREWRALFWYGAALLICTLIPILILGKNIYFDYQKVFKHVVWYASSWNASFYGFFMRLFNGTEKNIPLWSVPKLAPILYYCSSIITLLTTIKFLWPDTKITRQHKIALDFSIIIVTIMLISPLGWIYYFAYLFIPFCFLLKLAHEGHYPFTLRLTTCLAVVLTAVPYYLKPPTDISEHLFIIGWSSCYTYGLLLLYGQLFFMRYYLKHPKPISDNCPPYLALLLYICALLPSFCGILATVYNFNGKLMTTPPKISKLYFGST